MKKLTIADTLNSPAEQIKNKVKSAINNSKGLNIFLETYGVKPSKTKKGCLNNVPFSLKDNILLEGKISSCGSRMLEDFVSPYSAFVVEKLLAAGALPVGRTNMDEFAMGSSTENSAFGPTKNPLNSEYVPGGSSGGAAASVAVGSCAFALGSDTGGSVRQPAAFCDLYGFKPTYGVFSRRGLVSFCSSFDQIGIIANNVDDIITVSSVMNDKDPFDLTSYADRDLQDIEKINYDNVDLRGKIVGIMSGFDPIPVSDDIQSRYLELIEKMSDLGAEMVNISPPFLENSVPLYQILSTAEASSNLSRYDGIKYGLRKEGKTIDSMRRSTRSFGFGEEVKRRIILGTYVTASEYSEQYYKKALKIRGLMRKNYEAFFSTINYILLPTTPTPPFRLGEKINDPVSMYFSDVFTAIANILGTPAITMPCGESSDGLPIGIQLMGGIGSDLDLLKFAGKVAGELK
ncbi:Asp-tRNA(Asn)/Glu-tRNA(Gln) amidotransferase subunit GatA [bacterium]|nr:Asp-tRNA(Asn)/Glu-tRNA(Gln) amidotransferase subunit GatA [bacterium]